MLPFQTYNAFHILEMSIQTFLHFVTICQVSLMLNLQTVFANTTDQTGRIKTRSVQWNACSLPT